jgi:hypothetical protein
MKPLIATAELSTRRFCMPLVPRHLGFAVSTLGLALALAALPGLAEAATAPHITVGQNIQLSSDPFPSGGEPGTEVEPDIAINPNNPQNIVGVFQQGRYYDGGSVDPGWATTTNDGQTWTTGSAPGLTKAVGGKYDRASDPAVAFDRQGDVYFSTLPILDEGGGPTGVGVTVNKSTDGGQTWSNPVVVYENDSQFSDKDWIAVDNGASSPFEGRVYAVWDLASNFDQVEVAHSTDGGQTWSSPTAISGANGLGTIPLVQPNGNVTLIYEDLFGSYQASNSTDGGMTWSSPVTIASDDSVGVPNLRAPELPSGSVDPQTGMIYVVWQDARFRHSQNDIVLSTSSDGKSWSSPTRVTTDSLSDGYDHFTPGIFAVAGGVLVVSYSVQKESPSPSGIVYTAISASKNDGQTWSAPIRINDNLSYVQYAASTDQGPMLGDYQAVVATATEAHPIFIIANTPSGGAQYNEDTYGTAVSASAWTASPAQALPAWMNTNARAPGGHSVLPPGDRKGFGRTAF